ncbi:MAG TPA: hypothetical protein VEZ55_05340 [Chitinophagaceae bacterium]|jgi:hypothetical protein|nr:hypothetical protein [Chitinophagaceae bacterium]
MKEQRNNDVYNHPQSEEEVNEEVRLQPTQGGEQRMASNPNPRANENIQETDIQHNQDDASQAGSEITDGEAG